MDYRHISAALLVPALLFLWKTRSTPSPSPSQSLPLPPGPPWSLPLIGNFLNAPRDYAWKTYAEWSRKYGSDILYMEICGTKIVILNSREVAYELLVKKFEKYSGRPSSYMVSNLDCDWLVACLPDCDDWRASRNLLAKKFPQSRSSSTAGFIGLEWQRPHVAKYTLHFLENLIKDPDSFRDHTFRLAASISFSSIYGLDVSPDEDESIEIANKAIGVLKYVSIPGKLIDTAIKRKYLEWREYLPEWIKFNEQVKEWQYDLNRLLIFPFVRGKEYFDQRKRALKARKNPSQEELEELERSSLLSEGLKEPEPLNQTLTTQSAEPPTKPKPLPHDIIQKASATALVATTFTIPAALNVFFLAMTRYPEAQSRAQEELDALMKQKDRKLPTHADLEHLPYCMALVYEVLRWHPVGPVGLPHLSTEEDTYKDYRIPKDSTIIPNIWAMMRDSTKFQEPNEFKPERFLNQNGTLNDSAVKSIDPVFGFGSRACPGRFMALSIMSHAISRVLTGFNITKKLGKDGQPIEPPLEFDFNLISSPLPFECSIEIRSSDKKTAVLTELGKVPPEKKKADVEEPNEPPPNSNPS